MINDDNYTPRDAIKLLDKATSTLEAVIMLEVAIKEEIDSESRSMLDHSASVMLEHVLDQVDDIRHELTQYKDRRY